MGKTSKKGDICKHIAGSGEGNGNPLQYSCLENSVDRGAWWATVRGIAKRHNWATKHEHACRKNTTGRKSRSSPYRRSPVRANRIKETFVVVIQLLSHVWLFATSWTAACQPSLSFTVSWSFLKLMSIELVMLSNYRILCCLLLLLPLNFPSIRVFSSELTLRIRKYTVVWINVRTFEN